MARPKVLIASPPCSRFLKLQNRNDGSSIPISNASSWSEVCVRKPFTQQSGFGVSQFVPYIRPRGRRATRRCRSGRRVELLIFDHYGACLACESAGNSTGGRAQSPTRFLCRLFFCTVPLPVAETQKSRWNVSGGDRRETGLCSTKNDVTVLDPRL